MTLEHLRISTPKILCDYPWEIQTTVYATSDRTRKSPLKYSLVNGWDSGSVCKGFLTGAWWLKGGKITEKIHSAWVMHRERFIP